MVTMSDGGHRMSLASMALVAVALWGGCGTETGNPEGMQQVDLAYNARSSQPEQVGFDEGAEIVVDEVWLRLANVSVQPCDRSAVGFDGLGLADHGGVEAAAQRLEVDDTALCGVSTLADVAAEVDAGEPEVVDGAAVTIVGHRADGQPFVVRVDTPVDLGVELAGERPPSEGRWLLTFDVATWLDAGELLALPDEQLELDGQALSSVVDRLADGVQLFVDLDEDGLVDPDEPQVATVGSR